METFANCSAPPLIRTLVELQPLIELCISIPNLLLNVYFAFRFGQLGVFHPNLKMFMLTTNLASAFLSILHPIVITIPPPLYSLRTGHPLVIVFVYAAAFLLSVLVLVVDIKFLLIGMERRFAVTNSSSYDQKDGRTGVRVLLQVFLITSLLMLAKNAVVYATSSTVDVDDRLLEAFLFEHCPLTGAMTNLLAGVSLGYGIYQFHFLRKHTKKQRYVVRSLTEIYHIQETQKVIRVLIPLICAYFLLAAFCAGVIYAAIFLLFFVPGCTVHSFLYRFFVNAAYISVAFYTLSSTFFMLWRFAAVRKLLLDDLFAATGLRFSSAATRVVPEQLDSRQVQAKYFDQLTSAWDR